MTQAPTAVWNEVRFTSEGISISLFSESPDSGAILEDEMWYTYDELQEMAPSEPKSLRLSGETREALADSRQSALVGNLPEVGDVVRDGNPPSWSEDEPIEVVGLPDESASEYVVEERVGHLPDETVFDANPSCDSDEPVVEAEYLSGNGNTYAFPVSRLEGI